MRLVLCFLLICLLPAGSIAADISLRDAVTGQGLHGTLTYALLDAPVAPKAELIDRLLDVSPDRQSLLSRAAL